MLALQHGQQALGVKPLRLVEVQAHALGEGLVALRNRVVQVTHGDQLPQLQVSTTVHQQLQHQLERRAFALQRCRHRDQGLHQRRAERVHLAEHLPVCGGGEQGVQHVLAHLQHVVDGRLDGVPGSLVHRAQYPLLRNRRQVAVFQRDAVKARLPVPQHVTELHLHRPCQVLANQITQVTLPGDEADQRDRAVCVRCLHQLDQLGALPADEVDIGGMAGKP